MLQLGQRAISSSRPANYLLVAVCRVPNINRIIIAIGSVGQKKNDGDDAFCVTGATASGNSARFSVEASSAEAFFLRPSVSNRALPAVAFIARGRAVDAFADPFERSFLLFAFGCQFVTPRKPTISGTVCSSV